jgi:hypothetical protein
MSKQTYDQQSITQYLLGALPEAEGERFDELSVVDDEFADALSAAEKDLVDAYVQGELSEGALESFKSHYLASPHRREKVKFAQAFQSMSAKDSAAQSAAALKETRDETTTKRKGRGWFPPVLSVFTSPRAAARWVMAAAVLALFVTGGWLAWQNARAPRQLARTETGRDANGGAREQEPPRVSAEPRAANSSSEIETMREPAPARVEDERPAPEPRQPDARQQQPPPQQQQRTEAQGRATRPPTSSPASGAVVASFVLMPQMRGAGQLVSISVPAQTTQVAMRLELEPDDHPAYRVELLEQSGQKAVWRSNRLKATAQSDGARALNVRFGAGLLRSQTYVLRVSGVAADGASEIVGDYPFRVVK